MAQKVTADIIHESRETIARHIQLGDHFPAVHLASQALIERRVIAFEVDVELMSVAPIALTGGIKVELREFVKSPRLVPMDHLDQPIPIDL